MTAQSVPSVFGRRLRRERQARDWTIREAARKCGMAPATVGRAEAGRDIALSNALALAALYGVTLDWLLAGTACEACDGVPPDGFACLSCGAGAAAEAAS